MCLLQVNYKGVKCLHCDNDIGQYCESCYQVLLAENIKLQCEIDTYKEVMKEVDKQIRGK